jgi:hypothetical protein
MYGEITKHSYVVNKNVKPLKQFCQWKNEHLIKQKTGQYPHIVRSRFKIQINRVLKLKIIANI